MFDFNFVGNGVSDIKVKNGRLIITKKSDGQADETIEYDLLDVNLESYELQGKILKLKLDDGSSIDVDLGKFVDLQDLQNSLSTKADINHNHDEIYYQKNETDNLLSTKADANHNHNDEYYQKSEVDNIVSTKADLNHNHDNVYRKKQDSIKLSEVDVDVSKDWNDKEITNIKRIYKRENDGRGFEIIGSELRLYDKNNNCMHFSVDNDTKIVTKDEQGNILSGSIAFKRDRINFDNKSVLLFRNKKIFKTKTVNLLRNNIDLFNDASLHMNIASNYVYIGEVNAWGEVSKLPYRFALPINDDNELRGITLQALFEQKFQHEVFELDTKIDDGNGGKKKYKTIRFKPAVTDKYEIRLDMSFLLKSVDDNDWISVGIDNGNPNGTGDQAFRTGALQVIKNKFMLGSSATIQINGSRIVELRNDEWYYISVQSVSRGYFQNAMLSIKKHYDGSEG